MARNANLGQRRESSDGRQTEIVDVLVDAFSDLMVADPGAFRQKFRKMAAGPFAFYRGSACLFYADMEREEDRWADERTGRVWIQGDLHAENFGTYMDGDGVFVFDVNDFDEAYLGHFTWDIKRMVASVALLAWMKAISDADIAALIETYVRAYVEQVRHFVQSDRDHEYSLRLETTDGEVREILLETRLNTRVALLDRTTLIDENFERRFRRGAGVRELDDAERARVRTAFEAYLETIPDAKRFRSLTYEVKDIVGRKGFGIGSAGLPAYNVLVEGPTQALENDVVLSMKQGNVAAPSRIVRDERIKGYFKHHGHRTAVSQRALQAHADPWLGYTEVDGVGFVVSELSPYVEDLDWSDLTEPGQMAPVLDYLGRATAKIHCVADKDSDPTIVGFQTEDEIIEAIGGNEDEFVKEMVDFGMGYSGIAREDHRMFVDAFRNGQIPGLSDR
ncbi:MAG: FIG00830689: hypothetical protein [uncultured Rubrobacteraceae bacterium]|jgi:uncharacterized protein (DUF2252 family)|uniref:DUF2252 domain-containing protein n=1 Tax=uncultured Rubrobacteraceae bacterium TaxID=349277 RepID=A0A6J4P5D7_9ACTN|nr:MAG: FIG00830689: hypothetical protein [uncultured Rubrobacteraceae bacterium]